MRIPEEAVTEKVSVYKRSRDLASRIDGKGVRALPGTHRCPTSGCIERGNSAAAIANEAVCNGVRVEIEPRARSCGVEAATGWPESPNVEEQGPCDIECGERTLIAP